MGREFLETVDADTPSGELVYDVSTAATNGRLAYVDQPQLSISTFTQADVDDRRVVFLHDGSKETGAILLEVGVLRPVKFHTQRLRDTAMCIDVPTILQWRGFTWWGRASGSGGLPSPTGVQGQSPKRGLGSEVPKKLKQNVKLMYIF